jgi:RHS repeat-associated protein
MSTTPRLSLPPKPAIGRRVLFGVAQTTNSPPTTPTIVAPVSGATVETTNPVLSVASSDPEGDPISYQFQISLSSNFTNPTCQSGWLPTTQTWTIPDGCASNTLHGTPFQYFWRAQAEDNSGATSGWSPSTTSYSVNVPLFGERAPWPIWHHGPVAVNEATGQLMVSLPGPSIASVKGPISATPVYNEFDSTDLGLGPGWRFNITPDGVDAPVNLVDHSVQTGTSKRDAVELQYRDADSRWFNHVGDTTTYAPAHGEVGSIVTKTLSDNTWTFTADDGTVYTFGAANASGIAPLSSIQFPDSQGGSTISYTFNSSAPRRIEHITDASGRSINFVWHIDNTTACPGSDMVCVTAKDADGTVLGTWTYIHGVTQNLTTVTDSARTLDTLTYGTGGLISKMQNANDLDYTHASPNYNSSHALAITYHSTSNKVATVADGPIHTQPSGKQTSTWSFDYVDGPVSTTATRDAHAGIAQGTVRTANEEAEITPPNQQGAGSPKQTKVFVDGLGHPLEIDDTLGNITEYQYAYNDRGNLFWSEDANGNPTDNTWDTVNNLLSQTQAPDAGGGLGRPTTTYRYDEKTIGTPATPGPPLQGLQGWYWTNQNEAGRPNVKETDPNVDDNWGTTGPPALNGQGSGYSVRWVGDITIPSTGDYTFSTISSDGVRLEIDQLRAIHYWHDQTLTTLSSQPIHLTAGPHTIRLDYYKNTGPAEIHLHWACTACSPAITDQVIPTTNLQPAWSNQTSIVSAAGKISFSHYATPSTALPDYTLKQDNTTNYITTYSYDSYGRVTQKVMPKGNAASTIDANGNLTGTPDTTYATTYSYYDLNTTAQASSCPSPPAAANQAGQLQSKSVHGLTPITYVYDAFGSVLQTTDAAGTTCNTYTPYEDRLATSKAPGETSGLTYIYDPLGTTRSVTGDTGTVTTEHDEAGRLQTFIDSYGATASYSYDQDGNLTQRIAKTGSTQSANTTNYSYNDGDQLTSLTDPAGRSYSFYYDPLGNLHATQYPNGTFSWTDRNADNWTTAVYNRHGTLTPPLPGTVPADSQASPIADYSYTYNVDGEKTQEVRTGGGLTTETTNYGYDNLGRLTTVTLPDATNRIYSYDLDSNRTTITENGTTVATYTYDPSNPSSAGLDELTSTTQGTTTNYTYTGDGQVNGRGADTLTWDGRGRLSGGTVGGTTVSYQFDAAGFRRQRTGGATSNWYGLSGMFEGTGSTSSDTGLTNTDIDGPTSADLAHYTGLPRTSSTVLYQYYNGHGDLGAEADAAGNRTVTYAYDPFGYLVEGSAPANATPERWTAGWDKKLDSATGLIEMGARAYDPGLGRFLSADTVDSGCYSTYVYAGQDPVNLYDLSGTRNPAACPDADNQAELRIGIGQDASGNYTLKVAANIPGGAAIGYEVHTSVTALGVTQYVNKGTFVGPSIFGFHLPIPMTSFDVGVHGHWNTDIRGEWATSSGTLIINVFTLSQGAIECVYRWQNLKVLIR